MNFVEQCIIGKIESIQIHDFIQEWKLFHRKDDLPYFLGLTNAEYSLWSTKPEYLDLILAIYRNQPITFSYTNYKGDKRNRRAIPKKIWYGSTEYHPKSQWLLTANDLDKEATRDFALVDMYDLNVGG